MHVKALRQWLLVTLTVPAILCLCSRARADVGLIVENPDGAFGFLTNSGHASVWISDGCVDAKGRVRFCEHTEGVVLTGTGYWTKPGAAAIPAKLYFVGPESRPVADTLAAWNATLASTYPEVSPKLGRKYIGRVWRRSVRVLVFRTSPDEDRRLIERVQQERQDFRFSFYHHNCAWYAQNILELSLGRRLNVRPWLDLKITTPRSLELALQAALLAKPEGTGPAYEPRFFQFSSTRMEKVRPPRTLCESALFDPKYAVTILALQPELYPVFGGCYALSRSRAPRSLAPSQIVQPVSLSESVEARQIAMYQALTGGREMKSEDVSSAAEDEVSVGGFE